METNTNEFLQSLTPRDAFQILVEGNQRFVQNIKFNRNLQQQLSESMNGQFPHTVALSCMDSRTSVEHIFDQGIGDLFSIRIAGNILNTDILGSMEYACNVVGSKLIMVLGHTRCGAVKGACDQVEMGNLTPLLQKISPAIQMTRDFAIHQSGNVDAEKVAYNNVLHTMEQILLRSSIIKGLYEDGSIGIVGGMFSLESGKVHFTKEMFNNEEEQVVENGKFVMTME